MSELVVGPILAARAWSVRGGRLWSTSAPTPWPIREALEARCLSPGNLLSRRRGNHEAPVRTCNCGIWGMADPADLPPGGAAVGAVKLWGRVIEGTKGWRAQFAYPAALVGDPLELGPLALAYGVPVLADWPALSQVANPRGRLRAWRVFRGSREPRWPTAEDVGGGPADRP